MNDTRILDTLKARVTVPQAAAHYGVDVDRSGMCRCPFHSDKTPSMKINETYYYCFGCHSTGDVIDFTSRLFDLSPLEAARKLAADFGIDPNTPASAAVALPCIQQEESRREREGHCASVLIEHERLLTNLVGRRVWGFTGIEPVLKLPLRTADGWQRDYSDDNPFV